MKPFMTYWQTPLLQVEGAEAAAKNRIYVLTFSALMAAFAAIFQAAGGLMPGIGYLISPFSTLPVAIAAFLHPVGGLLTYATAIGLLLMLQPGELFIFPFTTGLLGLVIGLSLKVAKHRLVVILLSGAGLFGGILFVAFVLDFPLLGPASGAVLGLFGFSLFYSWIWMEISSFFLRRTFRAVNKS